MDILAANFCPVPQLWRCSPSHCVVSGKRGDLLGKTLLRGGGGGGVVFFFGGGGLGGGRSSGGGGGGGGMLYPC